jgi:Rod binding domain-containing protein
MSSDFLDPKIMSESAMAFSNQGEIERLKALAQGGGKNIEEVAAKFESIFIGILIKQMWESIEKSELLPESSGREIYDGLLTRSLADHIAANGGIGIAKALVHQLQDATQLFPQPEEPERDVNKASAEDLNSKRVTPTEEQREMMD